MSAVINVIYTFYDMLPKKKYKSLDFKSLKSILFNF
jgi:hypothetical protein